MLKAVLMLKLVKTVRVWQSDRRIHCWHSIRHPTSIRGDVISPVDFVKLFVKVSTFWKPFSPQIAPATKF